MIVDDEEIILEGLSKAIKWEDLEFRVEYLAENGEMALEYLKEHHLDLVIADVVMPYMDGIGLIKEISVKYPDVKTVILSGFNEFQYVQQALLYGASGYILKPTKIEELYTIINKVKDELKRQEEYIALRTEKAEKTAHNEYYLLENSLRELIIYNQVEQIKNIERSIKGYNYYIVLIKDLNSKSQNDLFNILKTLISEVYRGDFHVTFRNEDFIVIFIGSANAANNVKRTICFLIDLIKDQSSKFTISVEPCLTYSDAFTDIAESNAIYSRLQDKMKYVYYAKNGIIDIELPKTQNVEFMDINIESIINSIIMEANISSIESNINQSVDAIIDSMKYSYLPEDDIRNAVKDRLLVRLIEEISKYMDDFNIGKMMDFDNINNITDFKHLGSYLKQNLKFICDFFFERHTNYIKKIIQAARIFVEEHYAEEIILEDIAGHVSLSVSYFCHIFKNEMGITFINYLTNLRLEKSTRLILNSNLKIHEIAKEVGYTDFRHFVKLFKRKYKMTPTQYRNKAGTMIST